MVASILLIYDMDIVFKLQARCVADDFHNNGIVM